MEQREAVTIRFPTQILCGAKEMKSDTESLNDFVVSAVNDEIRRRQGKEALETIIRIREQVKARTGLHPDSAPLIRRLRDGTERRD